MIITEISNQNEKEYSKPTQPNFVEINNFPIQNVPNFVETDNLPKTNNIFSVNYNPIFT